MPEISIIVPVYKVEQYINKCVDSILGQTYRDFEVILVDDGSPDGSGRLCDEYAKEDSRVRVIHKPNGGLSDARNAGIDVARGHYIGFVDGDDYIAADMYQVLHEAIVKANAQLAICGIYDVYGDEPLKKKPNFYEELNREQATKLILEGNIISVHAVNKLYERQIFQTLRYPVGKYHEDSYIILDVLSQCSRIAVDSRQRYYYVHREGSINTENFSEKQFDFIDAWVQNEEKLVSASLELRHAAHQRVCFANFLVLDKLLRGNAQNRYPQQTRQIVRYLRSNYMFILRDKIFTCARKIAMTALMLNISLYALVIKFHRN